MYDFHIIKDSGAGINPQLGYELKFELANDKVNGLPILVNKVMKKLLTSYGSDAFAPTTGSDIKVYLQGSNITNTLSLTTALNNYIEQVINEIKADEMIIQKGNTLNDSNIKLGNIQISSIENSTGSYNGKPSGIVVNLIITDNYGNAAYAKLNADQLTENTANQTTIGIPNSVYDTINRVANGLN